MITTQSTTTKRRASVHKNLYDPALYRFPEPPLGVFQPKKQSIQLSSNEVISEDGDDKPSVAIEQVQEKFVSLFPHGIQQHLPEVDGKVTLVCLGWYVISSISSNLSKAILRDFTHPIALTEIQFLLNATFCILFISLVNFLKVEPFNKTTLSKACNNFPEGILPNYLNGSFKDCVTGKFLHPSKVIIIATFPMGIFQFVGHITSYKATSLIPVSLVHSMKALSPIITVGYYRLFQGKQYNPMTYLTLIPLILGVMVTCWSTHGNKKPNSKVNEAGLSIVTGLFHATVSMLIFVSQNIFAKSILTVKAKNGILPSSESSPTLQKKEISSIQIDKITILFYCSCTGFLLTLPLFLSGELFKDQSVFKDLTLNSFYLILIHGVTHFLQAMLAFQLIGMLSSVNYSVANIMKRIVIISVALIWESRFNFVQLLGLSMTLIGLYGYDKWGISRKAGYQL
ncbi:hypothetical protein HG535_0F00840 [Zygotorulaspora mrakii]|uniref:Sugar phosphate transporter domain-containing protein n=1 Tax=Zygotorulaspora mrakii TaxID=42260 RepID=A0A7H9B5D5_ZYGMR|nr:uncharacterized protein HG535_0F00840 [Zygotorulaspora mrakii]QLG73574.1 hypothetical protein HG535_0F00840 [Zygotorulaspora mrakii]